MEAGAHTGCSWGCQTRPPPTPCYPVPNRAPEKPRAGRSPTSPGTLEAAPKNQAKTADHRESTYHSGPLPGLSRPSLPGSGRRSEKQAPWCPLPYSSPRGLGARAVFRNSTVVFVLFLLLPSTSLGRNTLPACGHSPACGSPASAQGVLASAAPAWPSPRAPFTSLRLCPFPELTSFVTVPSGTVFVFQLAPSPLQR